jgi:hypothetical protein
MDCVTYYPALWPPCPAPDINKQRRTTFATGDNCHRIRGMESKCRWNPPEEVQSNQEATSLGAHLHAWHNVAAVAAPWITLTERCTYCRTEVGRANTIPLLTANRRVLSEVLFKGNRVLSLDLAVPRVCSEVLELPEGQRTSGPAISASI